MSEIKTINRNEIRMKLWCDVFATQKTRNLGDESAAQIFADESVDAFDKRFPAESSEDEPKRVWMLIDANGDLCSWQKYEEYAKALMLLDDRICAYAEFQQVGPKVRRDGPIECSNHVVWRDDAT